MSEQRAGAAAATPLRVASLLAGYFVVGLVALDIFAIPVGHLLVGGAVTGVILGIAAQQSLGNLVAGIVLLFARPYIPGERIRCAQARSADSTRAPSPPSGCSTTLATDDARGEHSRRGGLLAPAVESQVPAVAAVDEDQSPVGHPTEPAPG